MATIFNKSTPTQTDGLVWVWITDNHPDEMWIRSDDGETRLSVRQAQDLIGYLLEALEFIKEARSE